jgi:hypothetical protein
LRDGSVYLPRSPVGGLSDPSRPRAAKRGAAPGHEGKVTVSAELKPLMRLRTPVNLTVYRAEVEPFDSLRYLDLAKLAKATRATVELGVVRTPAGTDTLVAEVRRGEIVGLGPQHCSGCSGKVKFSESRMRDALTRVVSKLGPKEGVTLPMPINKVLGPRGLRAPLRPIVINVVTAKGNSCCTGVYNKKNPTTGEHMACFKCYTGDDFIPWFEVCVAVERV